MYIANKMNKQNAFINSLIKNKKKNINIKNFNIKQLIKKNLAAIKNKKLSLVYLNNKCILYKIKKKIKL